MKNINIVTDIALESATDEDIKRYCEQKTLEKGIVSSTLNVKTVDLSKRINKPKGVYVTYDCTPNLYSDVYEQKALTRHIRDCIKNLLGNLRTSTPVLVVGLGNKNIVADSLGANVIDNIKVTRMLDNFSSQSVAAINAGVLGVTGVQSQEIVSGIVDKIKPSHVITIDTLSTSVVSRLGRSFQLTSSGITPGGGVGYNKPRIDNESIGANVISIGVPLMLSMHVALYNFVKNYLENIGEKVHEINVREQLKDANLLNLIVSPKDIDFIVQRSAKLIANAINMALGN